MLHTLELARRGARLRAIVAVSGLLAIFASACNSDDNLATGPTVATNVDSSATDSLALNDSTEVDAAAISAAMVSRSGIPYGPTDLFRYSWHKPAVSGFSGGLLYASPRGIVKLLNGMKKHHVRAFLKMTGDPQRTYMTRGKFDYNKWKKATARYNTPTIRRAIAAAVADRTLLGYSMIDEPNRFNWNGSINKAMLDRMARYSKSLFPTLPTAAVVTYYWRPKERYKVMDVVISQTWKPKKSAKQFASEAAAAARQNGVALGFSLNLKAGPKGGNMTPSQIKEWSVALGKVSCAMFVWRYERGIFSRSSNMKAFRSAAAQLARTPAKSCRRSN
jgi:hypothetical protein